MKLSSVDYDSKLIHALVENGMSHSQAKEYREIVDNSYNCASSVSFNPHTLTINPTSLCNFKCIMCDVPNNNRSLTELDLKVLKDSLHHFKSFGIKCCILGSGAEITLYKNWRSLVDLCGEYFDDIIFMTNGSLLSSDDVNFILQSRITRLCFSLDASSEMVFKSIRGFDLLNKIEEKIMLAVTSRNANNSVKPLIRVSFVQQKENEHELVSFIDKWKDTVDSVEIQKFVDISGFRDKTYGASLPKIEYSEEPKCHYPWAYLSLWADGNISSCCTSYGRDVKELHYCNIKSEHWYSLISNQVKQLQLSFINNCIPNSCAHCLNTKNN